MKGNDNINPSSDILCFCIVERQSCYLSMTLPTIHYLLHRKRTMLFSHLFLALVKTIIFIKTKNEKKKKKRKVNFEYFALCLSFGGFS